MTTFAPEYTTFDRGGAPSSAAGSVGPAGPGRAATSAPDGAPGPRGQFSALNRLRTSHKLTLLTISCLLPVVLMAVFVKVSTDDLADTSDEILQNQTMQDNLAIVSRYNNRLESEALQAFLAGSGDLYDARLTEDLQAVQDMYAETLKLDVAPQLTQKATRAQELSQRVWDEAQASLNAAGDLSASEQAAAVADLAGSAKTANDAIFKLSAELEEVILGLNESAASDRSRIEWGMVLVLALGLAFGACVATWIGRGLTSRLSSTVDVLRHVADGNLVDRVDITSSDEIGEMGTALNSALDTMAAAMSQIDGNAQALAAASEELTAIAGGMAGTSQESAVQAGVVAAAAEQVSRNVQTVATGTEEMSASIREIAQNASSAAAVAAQAVSVAETTTLTVAKLGESSTEVGNVIKVINSIAEQTNLLALNATIEAARAGEAGKGFAVVANEVKELAQETSKATEDISRRIEAIQSDTTDAVNAIGEISQVIGQINDTQNTIASAVEEQTATTNEMSRNVSEAATGSSEIAQNITGVAQSAGETQQAVGSTNQAADELAQMASTMRALVSRFRF